MDIFESLTCAMVCTTVCTALAKNSCVIMDKIQSKIFLKKEKTKMKIFNKEIGKEQVINGLKKAGKIAVGGALIAVTYVVGFGSGMKHAENQDDENDIPAELPGEDNMIDTPEEEEPKTDESNEEADAE